MDAQHVLPGGGEVPHDGEDEDGVERRPHEEDAPDVEHGLALAVLLVQFNGVVISSVRIYNLGWQPLSQLSVNRFGKKFGGLLT